MKSDTEEKYLQQVNRVIDYINSHLNEPLRVETLAREVCLSEYHFHRIMRAYLHEPLATYIARQRVERAVMYLQMKNIHLAQVAEMVGYETPQSLSKAFKQFFGISPTAYRKRRAERYEEFSTLKKESLKPEILTEPELKLVYIRIIGRYGEEEPYIEAWRKLRDFLQINGLLTPSTRWISSPINLRVSLMEIPSLSAILATSSYSAFTRFTPYPSDCLTRTSPYFVFTVFSVFLRI